MRVALCPSRTITDVEEAQRDAHLRHRYAVCLEAYVLGYSVRALPCFHTFHTRCIDVWVFAKGLCPIDKYLCSYTYMFKFHGLNVLSSGMKCAAVGFLCSRSWTKLLALLVWL